SVGIWKHRFVLEDVGDRDQTNNHTGKETEKMSKQEIRPALKNPRHEAFAQAVARGMSASAAYAQVGFKPHRANAATLARKEHISVRVAELQEEQLAIHKQATAEAVANAKVTIESLIAEAEAARAKAMSEKGGAA